MAATTPVKAQAQSRRCPPGFHGFDRVRAGPTGRKRFMLAAARCRECGLLRPALNYRDWRKRDWVRRWNRRVKP